MESLRSLPQVAVALALAACGVHRGAWSVQRVADDFDRDASARAVAVAPDGSIVAVWQRAGAGKPLELVRYDRRGHVTWTVYATDPRCGGTPDFAPRVAWMPDGRIAVVAQMGVGKPACALAFTPAGQVSWATALPMVLGVPHVAVAGDRFVVTGKSPTAEAHVVMLDGTGAIAADRALPWLVDDLAATPDGTTLVIGRERIDPYPGALVALDAKGGTVWQRPVPVQSRDLGMHVAASTTGIVIGWRDRLETLTVAGLDPTGHEQWRRDVAAHGVVYFVGGRDGVALAIERGGGWVVDALGPTPTAPSTSFTLEAEAHDEEGGAPMAFLIVDGLALGKDALVIGGEASKRLDLGAAGVLSARCKREHEPYEEGGPDRTFEKCVSFGFLVRLPRK